MIIQESDYSINPMNEIGISKNRVQSHKLKKVLIYKWHY